MSTPLDPEAAVIGAAMAGYGDVRDLIDSLEPSDFYLPIHEEMWAAIGRLQASGTRPDPMTVHAALNEAGVPHDPVRLLDLAAAAPVVASAPFYADQVLVASGKRKLGNAAAKVHQLATSGSSDIDVLREEARAAIDEAVMGRVNSEARTIAEVLPQVLDVAQNGRPKMLGTGWPDVDRIIGGLAPGRLIIVGARPGVGKSLMGTNLALHFAHEHKHAVLFASLEMDDDEVTARLLANHARVGLRGLMDGGTTDSEWDLIAPKADEVAALPIRLLTAPDQTVTTIRREARNYQRVRDDLALIVVDYLQLMKVRERKNGTRAEALGEVSRGLKLLARETGACVVAMAQVNREAVRNSDGRPKVSDLRESGSIEADADVVILLHPSAENVGEIEVLIDKNRHGPKGQASLRLFGHYARLASPAWTPTGAIA